MPDPFQLIVGLGNPGPDYAHTRHNAGFWCIDRLARKYACRFRSETRFAGDLARLSDGDLDCWLLKPATFMNHSGRAVQALLSFYKLDIEQTLVLHDDIDLPPGTVRLKTGGGHGGHNGLRDLIQQTGSNAFSRVRIGVGHPGHRDRVIDSVLGRAGAGEQRLIDEAIDDVLALMPDILRGRMQKAMTVLHTVAPVDTDSTDGD